MYCGEIYESLFNNDDEKCSNNSTVNLLVVQEQDEKIKITIIIESKLSYSVLGFCNVSLFTNIFWRFPGIFIEKTTFEEYDEICEQIHKE